MLLPPLWFYMQAMKAHETNESDVKAKAERDFSDIQKQTSEGQKTPTRGEQEKESVYHPLPTDNETEPHSFEILLPDEQQETEEYMDTSEGPESFVDVKHTDVPGKRVFTKMPNLRLISCPFS